MNKRERERREQKAKVCRLEEWAESIPGKASDYLHWLDEYHKRHPDMQVVIYVRVSGRMQKFNDNSDTYVQILLKACKERNILVVAIYPEVSSGWILNENRYEFIAAVNEAQKHIERHTVILAPSTDRYLRNRNYRTAEPDLLPTDTEFKQLIDLACGVPLLTLLSPDMPPLKVRGIQSKWGQKAKGNKIGRHIKICAGYKIKQRNKDLPKVIHLYKQGAAISDIAKSVGRPRSTINDWILKYCA